MGTIVLKRVNFSNSMLNDKALYDLIKVCPKVKEAKDIINCLPEVDELNSRVQIELLNIIRGLVSTEEYEYWKYGVKETLLLRVNNVFTSSPNSRNGLWNFLSVENYSSGIKDSPSTILSYSEKLGWLGSSNSGTSISETRSYSSVEDWLKAWIRTVLSSFLDGFFDPDDPFEEFLDNSRLIMDVLANYARELYKIFGYNRADVEKDIQYEEKRMNIFKEEYKKKEIADAKRGIYKGNGLGSRVLGYGLAGSGFGAFVGANIAGSTRSGSAKPIVLGTAIGAGVGVAGGIARHLYRKHNFDKKYGKDI